MNEQQASFDSLPDAANVRVKTVALIYGVSQSTVLTWARDGRIPGPRRLSPRSVMWNVGEIRRDLASKKA